MELALSLGDASKPFKFLDKSSPKMVSSKDLEFCMALGSSGLSNGSGRSSDNKGEASDDGNCSRVKEINGCDERRGSTDPPLQLDLLPFSPAVPRNNNNTPHPLPSQPHPHPHPRFRLPWLAGNFTNGSEPEGVEVPVRGLDVNRLPAVGRAQEEEGDDGAAQSSPNSAMSAFQVDFGIRGGGGGKNKRDMECENERDCSRGSDDDENGLTRKKLRLSKEQSAFLEESFKEHSTLNPKQKLALAKQLNLRPRQVEVWFQNRRARTKLKQTEIDCEYLKRCCETLTEENRRLQKELQELRALKTSQPFFMQLPATTLTMCPSCERVATTSTTAPPSASAATNSIAAANPAAAAPSALPLSLAKPRAYPFPQAQVHIPQAQSQAQSHQANS